MGLRQESGTTEPLTLFTRLWRGVEYRGMGKMVPQESFGWGSEAV